MDVHIQTPICFCCCRLVFACFVFWVVAFFSFSFSFFFFFLYRRNNKRKSLYVVNVPTSILFFFLKEMSRHRGCSHIQSVVAQPVFTSRVSRSFSRLQRRLLQRELPGKRRVLDPSDAFPETLPRVLSHDRQAPHLRHEPNLQWRQLHARMAGLQGWLREPRLRLLAGAGEAAHAHQQRRLRIQVGCVGYHMCGILFILQRISVSNIYII